MSYERTWTIANTISSSRIFLLAPLAYCLFSDFNNNRLWAAGIVATGALTDFVDGYLARRLHQVSDSGKIIDPVADKVAVGALAVFLVILGDIPAWYLGMVLARDVLIVAGGLFIKAKKGIVVQSNWPGKIAVSLVVLFLMLSILRREELQASLS
jgi:CDP-diacylglycerol--glycerol-3-phosphate 3-phosphatidyltransferase